MATVNAINYLKLQEDKRSNLAREAETNRSNLANEQLGRDTLKETGRHNVETERLGRDQLVETNRANVAREVETNRANLAKERETNRHNKRSEYIDMKIGNSNIYRNVQQGNLYNAQTAKQDMDNAEYAKLGYTGAAADAQNKQQTVYKTMNESSKAWADTELKTAQASTEGTKAAGSFVGNIFKGISGLLK